MMRYLEVNDGLVTGGPYLCDDDEFVTEIGWVGPIDGMTPEPGVGWSYDGTTWTPPPPEAEVPDG
jgi:hypothetical protein